RQEHGSPATGGRLCVPPGRLSSCRAAELPAGDHPRAEPGDQAVRQPGDSRPAVTPPRGESARHEVQRRAEHRRRGGRTGGSATGSAGADRPGGAPAEPAAAPGPVTATTAAATVTPGATTQTGCTQVPIERAGLSRPARFVIGGAQADID